MCEELSKQAINKSVADYYKNVATDAQEININPIEFGKLLGYSEEELASAPAETNAGLGCGNPHRNARIKTGEVVVDLGCGKGMDVFIAAGKVGETGRVIGIDMVSEMVDQARLTSEKHHFPNVEFRVGKVEQLPLESATADLVISNGVISLTTNKPQVFREIYRILKPGGRISIADITLAKPLPGSVLADTNQYDIWVAGAITLDKLTSILSDTGFEEVVIETQVLTDEYAAKWGIAENLQKDHLRSSIITAKKPLN